MNQNLSTRANLLHGVALNEKGKLIWTESFEELQLFVKETLNLTDGNWGCPEGTTKQFKSDDIDLRWYPDTLSITLNGKRKGEIIDQMKSVALDVSGNLANLNDSNEGSHFDNDFQTSILNTNDSRASNDPKCPVVDKAFKDAFVYLKKRINEMNTTFNKKINDLENEIYVTKEHEQHALINELKRENQKLKDENQALRDRITNLSLIASDMNTKIKDIDNERLSLITAIKLLQSTPLSHANSEEPQHTQTLNETTCKQNSKQNQTQNRRTLTKEPSISLSNRYEVLSSDDDDEQTANKSNDRPATKPRKGQDRHRNIKAKSIKSPVVILGDSMIKMVQSSKLSRSAGQRVQIKTFPGATTTDMKHYVQPTLHTKRKTILLHVGTNDIQHKEPKEIVEDMKSLCEGIVGRNSSCEIAISEIVRRQDSALNIKIHETNKLLSNLCEEFNWYYISHSNINTKHLNGSGLHLNRQGTATLAKNYINFFKT